ncbi:MAG: DegV family protein [Desulfobacteraceae bacterium]|nr:DegV family protein [Desulfobacteraceae bacterium]
MSRSIGIITDTTVDLPKGLAKRKNITLIPIHILVNEEERLHGVNIINQEVVEHLIQKDDVSTSPPTPREYHLAYKKISDKYDQIYSLHVSSELSKCYENAKHGLRLLRKKQKAEERGIFQNNIKIIDTRSVSISQGQIVYRIASLIQADQHINKLDKYLPWLIKNAKMFFVVDDLFWLKRQGRVSIIAGFFGNLFDIKPIIKLEDGELIPIDKLRGKDIAIDNMVKEVVSATKKYKRNFEIWVAHSASLLDAKNLKKQLAAKCKIEPKKIPIIEVGPTIATHTGPGAVCVSVLPK